MLKTSIWGVATLFATLATTMTAQAGMLLMSTSGGDNYSNQRAAQLGHDVTTNSLSGMVGTSASALNGYDVVWVNSGLSGGDYDQLRSGVSAGGSLEQFVSAGGTLVLNLGGSGTSQHDIAPGGVDLHGSHNPTSGLEYLAHNVEFFESSTNGFFTGEGYDGHQLGFLDFLFWGNTDGGTLQGLAPGSEVLLGNVFGDTMVQYQWGSGTVLLSTLSFGDGLFGAKGKALDNLIDYSVHTAEQNVIANPEPASLAMFGVGMAGLIAVGAHRRRKQAA